MRFAMRALVAFSVLGVSLDGRADVLQVGVGGYATPQLAIDVASDGDVILIDGGAYPGFALNDKALFIAASDPANSVTLNGCTLSHLAPGKTVVLAHMTLAGASPASGLQITSCAGAVRIQDCTLRSTIAPVTGRGVFATSSANIVLNRCTVRSANGIDGTDGGWAYPALEVANSSIAVHQSTCTGGSSGKTSPTIPISTGGGGPSWTEPGASGVRAEGSFLFVNESTILGGNGGAYIVSNFVCSNNTLMVSIGHGGHGVEFHSAPSAATFAKSQVLTGAVGNTNCVWTKSTLFGQVIRNWNSSLWRRVGGGTARGMTLPNVITGAAGVTASFTGEPGELVHVVVSPSPAFAWSTPLAGVIGVSSVGALPQQNVGQIDATGSLPSSFALPPLPPATANAVWHVQSYFTSPTGSVRLGPSSCVAQLP
jgi:hypothetical protein